MFKKIVLVLWVGAFAMSWSSPCHAQGGGGPVPAGCEICFNIDLTTCLDEFGPRQKDNVPPLICTNTCEPSYMFPLGFCHLPVGNDALAPGMTPYDWSQWYVMKAVPAVGETGFAIDPRPNFKCSTRARCDGCEYDEDREGWFCVFSATELSIKLFEYCRDANDDLVECPEEPLP